MYTVGCDVGGTFTDVVLVENASGERHSTKVMTTYPDPSGGVLEGLQALTGALDIPYGSIGRIVHGTTVATNAHLTGNWARAGVITTRGFRDILSIGRQLRPHMYDYYSDKPRPLIAPDLIVEVGERTDASGVVFHSPDPEEVVEAASVLVESRAEAIAVCFLNSYANPETEEMAVELIKGTWPQIYVAGSAEVVGEFREYERFSTAALSVALGPRIIPYLTRLRELVVGLGIHAPISIMQSNGGIYSLAGAASQPTNLLFSGPAAGVNAAVRLAASHQLDEVVTLDIGGTSADICLITGQRPLERHQFSPNGYPIKGVSLDIHSIGAGGGSIAWLDPGGLLKVGPRSVGSTPGPASYGRGGKQPTVTDALIVLGLIRTFTTPTNTIALDREAARSVIADLAETMKLPSEEVADGIVRVLEAQVADAMRLRIVESGLDSRAFSLVAYGGGGPIHACNVASRLGIRKVLFPATASVYSAYGLLASPPRGDFGITRVTNISHPDLGDLRKAWRELLAPARKWCEDNGIPFATATLNPSVDVRYLGQGYELTVAWQGPIERETQVGPVLTRLLEDFHQAHQARYGYAWKEREVEAVTFRLTIVAAAAYGPAHDRSWSGDLASQATAGGQARIYSVGTGGWSQVEVITQPEIRPGKSIVGPALIEGGSATAWVPGGVRGDVLEDGTIVLEIGGDELAGTRAHH